MIYSTFAEYSFQVLVLPGRNYTSEYLRYAILDLKMDSGIYYGSTMFGGLSDRCTISPFDVVYSNNKEQVIDGFTHIKSVSTINNSNTLASHAIFADRITQNID